MLSFTGLITRDGDRYASLCPELDVASFGASIAAARGALLEAATLHIEGAIEDGVPYLRPVPADDDPRTSGREVVIETFRFTVDVTVHAHA